MESNSPSHPAMLVLEYLKVFIWPVLLLIGVFTFKPQIEEILQTREISVGSLTVGKKIDGIEDSVQQQLAVQKHYIEQIDANANNPALVRENARWLLGVIPSVQKNVGQDILALKNEIQADKTAPTKGVSSTAHESLKTAQDWELKGFEALMAKDVDAAISALAQAEALSPSYHNVAEIHRLLVDKRDALKARDADWKAVYKSITGRYSWGMPTAMLNRLKSELP